MGVIESKTFKSGNSVAVERNGTLLTIKPAFDPIEEKRKLLALIAKMPTIFVTSPA